MTKMHYENNAFLWKCHFIVLFFIHLFDPFLDSFTLNCLLFSLSWGMPSWYGLCELRCPHSCGSCPWSSDYYCVGGLFHWTTTKPGQWLWVILNCSTFSVSPGQLIHLLWQTVVKVLSMSVCEVFITIRFLLLYNSISKDICVSK